MPSFPFFRERPQKHEWIGGRYVFPVDIGDGREAFRPDIFVWLELPHRTLVGSSVIDPEQPVTAVESLEEAMLRPAEGPPRRPIRIRVPDETMANELRRAFRNIPIIVAPVPELDESFAKLSAMAEREANPSYLDGGATSPAVVEEFFAVASLLFRAAPWRRIRERQLIGVDIPAFEIRDACLSVVGGAGQAFGLLLFRSIDDYESFAMRFTPDVEDVANDDAAVRSVTFDRKKDLPPSLIREIRDHRWPVAGSKAYPAVICIDAYQEQMQPIERDFRILTACTRAFLSFLEKHRDVFDDDDTETVSEEFETGDGVTVTLTAPYGDQDGIGIVLSDEDDFVEPPLLISRSVGRNDPCPCGSGKKYKKCHLDADSR